MMYLGIDIGTSGIKTVVINCEQHIIAQITIPLALSNPKPLWSEQNPEDWFDAVLQGLSILQQEHAPVLAQVSAIGLTGQMHGAVCLDRQGKVLRPAILWNDGRSYRECDDLMQRYPEFLNIGANCVMPGFTAPKLLWLQRHEPELFQRIDKVLLPKDYIRYRLTDELATDMSDAAGTLWLDVAKRCWSEKLLQACGLTLKHMPPVLEGTEVAGILRSDLARRFGMQPVPCVAGASDNAAGALSMGVIHNGQAMLSLGTSGVYFVASDQCRANASRGLHSFCHCIPNTWHQMGVILAAASALSWWHSIHGQVALTTLIDEAQQIDKADIPVFLPYLSGERTPHNNPHATARFDGMRQNTTRAHLTQAVLEGVAFAFADCQDVIYDAGTQVNSVCVIGGGARSQYWGKLIASILDQPLQYHQDATIGPAFGAARLALISDGYALEKVATAPPLAETIQPDNTLQSILKQRLQRYRESYRANT